MLRAPFSGGIYCKVFFAILLSEENQEHLYLCAYYSAFLTKSSLRGLAQSLEETTDHRRGRKPPVGLRQQKKPRRGDRVLNMLFANQLDVLSPLRGFCFVDAPVPGACAPVCVLSHLRCFFPNNNLRNNYFPGEAHALLRRGMRRGLHSQHPKKNRPLHVLCKGRCLLSP